MPEDTEQGESRAYWWPAWRNDETPDICAYCKKPSAGKFDTGNGVIVKLCRKHADAQRPVVGRKRTKNSDDQLSLFDDAEKGPADED